MVGLKTFKSLKPKEYDDLVDLVELVGTSSPKKLSSREYSLYTQGYRDCLKDAQKLARHWLYWLDDRDTLYSAHINIMNWIKNTFNMENKNGN